MALTQQEAKDRFLIRCEWDDYEHMFEYWHRNFLDEYEELKDMFKTFKTPDHYFMIYKRKNEKAYTITLKERSSGPVYKMYSCRYADTGDMNPQYEFSVCNAEIMFYEAGKVIPDFAQKLGEFDEASTKKWMTFSHDCWRVVFKPNKQGPGYKCFIEELGEDGRVCQKGMLQKLDNGSCFYDFHFYP
jgi:hypothetical protein